MGPCGMLSNWKYSSELNKKELIKYIIRDEQRFVFFLSKYLEEFVKNALNPQFKGHSRNTTRILIHK